MIWCNFLHFYQPASQQKDILEAVVNQCYRPVFSGLLEKDRAKLTINISGALFELLDKYNFGDVIDTVKKLYDLGRVEMVSTSCYHAFLPLLSDQEAIRQIEINNKVLKRYLGNSFSAKGFFPPEMGCTDRLVKLVAGLGFEYIVLDEIAYKNKSKKLNNGSKIFKYQGTDLHVFYRQQAPSNIIMSGIERDSDLITKLLHDYSDQKYLITAMDGETFGHHRPGLEVSFLELFDNENTQFGFMHELLSQDMDIDEVSVRDSTWASSIDDISKGIQFISWNDPSNKLHAWQWELLHTMLKAVESLDKSHADYSEIRTMVDKALASDQFFWACAKPWWSVEMIEAGVYACLATIENIPGVDLQVLENARTLYRNIISTAFEWQRTGKIREMSAQRNVAQRIPFKTRTLEVGGIQATEYKAFTDMMRSREVDAAKKGDYEKAILWRDAVYKLETKNDIYDAINVIDMLRIEMSNEKVEQMLDAYKEDYRKIRGGQPEQRSN